MWNQFTFNSCVALDRDSAAPVPRFVKTCDDEEYFNSPLPEVPGVFLFTFHDGKIRENSMMGIENVEKTLSHFLLSPLTPVRGCSVKPSIYKMF